MNIWLRWAGLLVVVVGAAAVLGWFSILAGDEPAASEVAHGRWREVFWFGVFAMVMATAIWVALRRQGERLQRVSVRVRR